MDKYYEWLGQSWSSFFDSKDLLESKGVCSDKMEVIYNGIFEDQNNSITDEDLV